MKIIVLNGSPKTDANSVSMQYQKYLAKCLQQVDFVPLNVANMIVILEKDKHKLDEIVAQIATADAVLWCFPLYYLLVSAQMKRFIELIFERNAEAAFQSKPTAAIATSIHFCDNYALNYIKEISEDLGMNYFDHYSAAMDDLSKSAERTRLSKFAQSFVEFVQKGSITPRQSLPLSYQPYRLELSAKAERAIQSSKRIEILTDDSSKDGNLSQMTHYLQQLCGNTPELINLHDIKILGGCRGCIHCGYDFTCVYDGKDDYRQLWETKLIPADIIIFAGSIRDRYLSAKWKQFFDRSFFHNHTPLMAGKQVGMVVSGPLRQLENLKTIFRSYFEIQLANLCGFVSDDYAEPEMIEQSLMNLANQLVRNAEQSYIAPHTFYGVAGHKIFRDALYSQLRFPFIKDYKSFKLSGRFDFPQKQIKTILISHIMILLTHIPKLRKEIYTRQLINGMIQPFKKIINHAGKTDA